MRKIITNKGIYTYKQVYLFDGKKKINKEIATRNLLLLKEILDNNSIEFILLFGTLLGAIRDKGFITYDEDIDLAILEENRTKILDLLFEFRKVGLEVARYDDRGLLSLIKNEEYIDLYFFKKYESNILKCCGMLIPKLFLEDLMQIDFLGEKFNVPVDYEGYLEYQYGSDWRIPVEYKYSNFKLLMGYIKSKVKVLLSNRLKKKFIKKSEQKYLENYEEKLRIYNQKL